MGSKRRSICLTVVGDPGVGKTSLILAAVKQDCPEHPVPTLPPTSLPADLCPDAVPCVVMDTSSRLEDRLTLEQQCLKADAILLLWSKDDDECFKRLSGHWLPELRRMGVCVPIILVGSRHDLAPGGQRQGQQPHELSQLMMHYKEVEVCLECSAKKLQFVEEVFYYAVKSVIHPTTPLYDTATCTLQPPCFNALKRIFLLCDRDGDGLLSDDELNAFQVHCWKTPLKKSELEGIKQVAADKMPQSVAANGLTLAGFVFLHSLFIEKGRLETTWAVLRSFGYGDDVRLRDDILDEAAFPGRSPDQTVELTDHAQHFLSSVFRRFDHDHDGALSPDEQRAMFSTAPCNPWEGPELGPGAVMAETSPPGGGPAAAAAPPASLTHSGFLSMWSYMALVDPRAAFANAMYLGYGGDASQLLSISSGSNSTGSSGSGAHQRRLGGGSSSSSSASRGNNKDDASSGGSSRSVVRCCVFGPPGSGKTSLLRGLVGLPPLRSPSAATHAADSDDNHNPSASSEGPYVPVPLGDSSPSAAAAAAASPPNAAAGTSSAASASEAVPSVAVGAVDAEDLGTVLVMREVGPRQLERLLGNEGPSSSSLASSSTRKGALRSDQGAQVGQRGGGGGGGGGAEEEPEGDDEPPSSPRAFFAACDVAVFVFDSSSPESFREAHAQLRDVASASGDTLPCLLVAAKDDLGMSQALAEECGAACEALAMQKPAAVSMRLGETHGIYAAVSEAARNPHRHIPETETLKALREYQKTLRRCLVAAGAGVSLWVAGYALYSWWTSKGSSSSSGRG